MITLITGGQRSGKSMFAESLALQRCSAPTYLATARIFDEDFRKRVEIHKQRRGTQWSSIEVPLMVGDVDIPEGSTVLLDCLTLLATNWLFECGEDIDIALARLKEQLEALIAKSENLIIVSNEIGLGGVSPNPLQRKFADLQGSINQFAAARADEVYMVLSGIPVKIK